MWKLTNELKLTTSLYFAHLNRFIYILQKIIVVLWLFQIHICNLLAIKIYFQRTILFFNNIVPS